MRRLRLEPAGDDKFQIFIPGDNGGYPIGAVNRIPLTNPPKWKIKPYFMTRLMDDDIFQQRFDDSIKGARLLADLYTHIDKVSKLEITEPFEFVWPDDGTGTD
tara:strand:- start:176 stop:484 length:309 start_codon:yes stop_codon:yes gene_type:complete